MTYQLGWPKPEPRNNIEEAWIALQMIREAVETLGPVGAMRASEYVPEPTMMAEAEEIVRGIQRMADQCRSSSPA